MTDLLHTFDCPIPGFEALQITVNLGLKDQDVLDGWKAGENRAIVGFPGWTDGEPPIPLTMDGARKHFSIVVSAYLTGYDVINDALRDYMSSSRPFLKPR